MPIKQVKKEAPYPTVLNAANEEAVAAFLNHKITFLQIEDFVQQALERHDKVPNPSLDEIKLIDMETRKWVASFLVS